MLLVEIIGEDLKILLLGAYSSKSVAEGGVPGDSHMQRG